MSVGAFTSLPFSFLISITFRTCSVSPLNSFAQTAVSTSILLPFTFAFYTDVIITIILYFIILHNKYFILVLFVVILTNFSHVTIFFINISCFIFLCHYIWYTWCDYLITKKRPFSCQFKKRHCFL